MEPRYPTPVFTPESATANIDLYSLVATLGLGHGGETLVNPKPRLLPENPAEILDKPTKIVGVSPAPIEGYIDGIQASRVLSWQNQRPIVLQYAAAGLLTPEMVLKHGVEQLGLFCAEEDKHLVDGVVPDDMVVTTNATEPDDVTRNAVANIHKWRETLELTIAQKAIGTNSSGGLVVCDGSLIGHKPHRNLVGLIKTVNTRYLADETVLWSLPFSWRSSIFKMPPNRGHLDVTWSCYLRLTDAQNHRWDYGLVRLESFNPDLLEPLAAQVLNSRQNVGNTDPRGDRHIGPIAAVETHLKARRSPIFDL